MAQPGLEFPRCKKLSNQTKQCEFVSYCIIVYFEMSSMWAHQSRQPPISPTDELNHCLMLVQNPSPILGIAFFNDNDFTSVMPAEVCANCNNTSPPGFLGTLVADCNPPDDPEVECSCKAAG